MSSIYPSIDNYHFDETPQGVRSKVDFRFSSATEMYNEVVSALQASKGEGEGQKVDGIDVQFSKAYSTELATLNELLNSAPLSGQDIAEYERVAGVVHGAYLNSQNLSRDEKLQEYQNMNKRISENLGVKTHREYEELEAERNGYTLEKEVEPEITPETELNNEELLKVICEDQSLARGLLASQYNKAHDMLNEPERYEVADTGALATEMTTIHAGVFAEGKEAEFIKPQHFSGLDEGLQNATGSPSPLIKAREEFAKKQGMDLSKSEPEQTYEGPER